MHDSDIRIRGGNTGSIRNPDENNNMVGEKIGKSNQNAKRETGSSESFSGLKAFFTKVLNWIFGSPEQKAARETQRSEKKLEGSITSLSEGIAKGVATEGMMDNCLSIVAQAKKSNSAFPKMGVHDALMKYVGNMQTEDLQAMADKGISKLSKELQKICESSTRANAFPKEDFYQADLRNMPQPDESEIAEVTKSRKSDVSLVMSTLDEIVAAELKNRERM